MGQKKLPTPLRQRELKYFCSDKHKPPWLTPYREIFYYPVWFDKAAIPTEYYYGTFTAILQFVLKHYESPLASLFKHQEERLPIQDEPRERPQRQEYEEQEVIEDTVPQVKIAVIFLYPFP